jgi:hypothetical protein
VLALRKNLIILSTLLLFLILPGCDSEAQQERAASHAAVDTSIPSPTLSQTPARKIRPPTKTATPWISRTPTTSPTTTPLTPTKTPGSTGTFAPVIFSPDAGTGSETEAIFVYSWDSFYLWYLDMTDMQDLHPIARLPIAIRFAHEEQLMAYVDLDGTAWISDLMNQRKVHLFKYESPIGEHPQVLWTPDDQHIIFDMEYGDSPAVIYHRQSGQFEEWPYRCDRIAISPQSKRAALWCPSDHDENWAVVEWGGELWYANKAPDKTIVKSYTTKARLVHSGWMPAFNRIPIYRNAAWSPDGEWIAFFVPEDQHGDLRIVNAYGEEIQRYKALAYWLAEGPDEVEGLSGSFPLQWSQDNAKLLIYGVGEKNNPCPSRLHDGVIYHNPGCWQILDIQKGKTVWSMKSFVDSLPDFEYLKPEKNEFFSIGNASISPQGRYVSFYCCGPPDKRIYVLDVELGSIIHWARIADVQHIRWGLLPTKR